MLSLGNPCMGGVSTCQLRPPSLVIYESRDAALPPNFILCFFRWSLEDFVFNLGAITGSQRLKMDLVSGVPRLS